MRRDEDGTVVNVFSRTCLSTTLFPQITRVAQDWANHLAQSDTMQHRSNNNYGENIYATTADNVNGKDAVDSWYGECAQYTDYKHDPSTSGRMYSFYVLNIHLLPKWSTSEL